MSPEEFETYCFLRLYSVDLDTAESTIRVLRRYKRGDVQAALLRDLAVTYARPFSVNRGKFIPKHQLPVRHVPREYRALHLRLLSLRNEQFAHTDLRFHNPKVMKLRSGESPIFAMSLKSFDHGLLLRELPSIESMVRSVAGSVNQEVAVMQAAL